MGCISTCLWSTCSELAGGGETQGAKDVQYIEQPHEADHKRNDRKLYHLFGITTAWAGSSILPQ